MDIVVKSVLLGFGYRYGEEPKGQKLQYLYLLAVYTGLFGQICVRHTFALIEGKQNLIEGQIFHMNLVYTPVKSRLILMRRDFYQVKDIPVSPSPARVPRESIVLVPLKHAIHSHPHPQSRSDS